MTTSATSTKSTAQPAAAVVSTSSTTSSITIPLSTPSNAAPDLTKLPVRRAPLPTDLPAAFTANAPVEVDGYNVYIGSGLTQHLTQAIKVLAPSINQIIFISDTNVFPLYGDAIVKSFQSINRIIHTIILPPGESTKTREIKSEIEDRLLSLNIGRDSLVLALGGGVIGDLSGYIASTYMRGIPIIHLPTSLLAMVDSSVGGKTGVDTPRGKNLIGTFWRPLAVIIDTNMLASLPKRELCNGMAESIKAGAIADPFLFELIENHVEDLLNNDRTILNQVIHRSVVIKANVVRLDERESGIRSILNFGHSIGHAIEAINQPFMLHGECVAIGMIEEAILARSMGYVTSACIRRIDQVCQSFFLPTKVPQRSLPAQLIEKMAVDKKNKGGRKEIVMLTSIGSVRANPYTTSVTDDQLLALLSQDVTIIPSQSKPHGEVAVPGSKSLSNRILLMAAMGRGPCSIRGLLHSQDTQVMLDSLRELGVKFEWQQQGEVLLMHGSAGRFQVPSKPLFLNNAGTASRFLTSLVCCIPSGQITLTGNSRMQERPIADLVDALTANGCKIEYQNRQGCLPILVRSVGGLPGGTITLRANISSQYVSSILLSAPHAMKPVTLVLDSSAGGLVSKPFIDMSIDLMKQFHIDVTVSTSVNATTHQTDYSYTIARGVYANPSEILVEGDASSASYALALAAVSRGACVTVTNVGSRSLQGDAKFCTLLEKMGCSIQQTPMTTTVTGPLKLSDLTGIDVDMDSMTDCFMTLAAVAAVASGRTRITGIANQRVKECDRIAVTVEHLRKIGIDCEELPDGLSIRGPGGSLPKNAANANDDLNVPLKLVHIDCHDDHRIAMSFSILGCLINGIVIDERRCVDKTYPEYWDHLKQHLHVTCLPSAAAYPSNIRADQPEQRWPSDKPLVIIGMRGAGKTTIGRVAAVQLGRKFVDLDEELEKQLQQTNNQTIKQFVASAGWPAFRARELAVFENVMGGDTRNLIISCGGGLVETEKARARLIDCRAYCIWLHRHIDDILNYLIKDQSRPSLSVTSPKPAGAQSISTATAPLQSEEMRGVYEARRSLYEACSTHVFDIAQNDDDWQAINQEFVAFVRRILGYSVNQSIRLFSPTSFFLSLTFPDVKPVLAHLSTMTQGVDAIELRVDLLNNRTGNDLVDHSSAEFHEYVRTQLVVLRRATKLPIIFTVRSASQGGAFKGSEAERFRLYSLGIRCGCEVIDLEATSDHSLIDCLFDNRGAARIIGSHHVLRRPVNNHATLPTITTLSGVSESDLHTMYADCALGGRADIIKIVVSVDSEREAVRFMHLIDVIHSDSSNPYRSRPLIALAMGERGQISRVMNRYLTPVTHPLLPKAAAPGQMTVAAINQARSLMGMLPSRQFHLFGSPITHSPSPLMHNTAFEQLNYPWTYTKIETTELSKVATACCSPSFGGASVTIPLKEQVAPLLAQQSESARQIGSINTIIRLETGELVGDNTDWIGIARPICAKLQIDYESTTSGAANNQSVSQVNDVAVVIGAGGTARAALFALQKLGFTGTRLLLHNPRTPEKATPLADEFKVTAVDQLNYQSIQTASKCENAVVRVVVSTVPSASQITLDQSLYQSRSSSLVVMDVSYLPAETPLTLQASQNGALVVKGLDMLLEQGLAQFELFTGRSRAIVEDKVVNTVRESYQKQWAQSLDLRSPPSSSANSGTSTPTTTAASLWARIHPAASSPVGQK